MSTTSQPGTRFMEWVPGMRRVLHDVAEERLRQFAQYGSNDDLDMGMGPRICWLLPYTTDNAEQIEQTLRDDYEDFEEDTGKPTWTHLLREELAEALSEADPIKREQELIQVAALAVSCVETSRRLRGALPS